LSPALKKQTEERALFEPRFKRCRKKGFLWRNAWLCFEMVLKEGQILWEPKRVEGDGENNSEEAMNIEFESIM